MPGRLAFDEAIALAGARLRVPDPDLRGGQVEFSNTPTRRGMIRRPWGVEGGFAIVYKFRTRSGQLRALRCFHGTIHPDIEERYEKIAAYFSSHAALKAITAGFKYHRSGILVKEQGQINPELCPLIEMDWIEGQTLCEAVRTHCQQGNQRALEDLARRWLEIIEILRDAQCAHGDLAGTNVLVRGDGRLVLIDYDGVYVPTLAGYPPILAGQADYQHPQMLRRPFNEKMDDFSALVISLALQALALRPQLWARYTRHDEQGRPDDTSLLFGKEDFADPQRSPLLREMESLPDPRLRSLVQELRRACAGPITSVAFPFGLFDPLYEQKQALARLQEAVSGDDDEQIIACWKPLLEQYAPAQGQRQRVELARQRLAALQRWRGAIGSHSLAAIVATYDPVLDACKAVRPQERSLLMEARRFLDAAAQQDDETLLAAAETLTRLQGATILEAQRDQIGAARTRRAARAAWTQARQTREVAALAAAYARMQQAALPLSPSEEEQGRLATRFMTLIAAPQDQLDDEALLKAYEAIVSLPMSERLQFSPEQREQVELAERRIQALARLRMALLSRQLRRISAADDPILRDSQALRPEERERVVLARRFMTACEQQDDGALIEAADVLETAHQGAVLLTAEERERVALARQRHRAYCAFLTALASGSPRLIVAAYQPLLEPRLNERERETLRLAQEFIEVYEDDQRLCAWYERVRSTAPRSAFTFTPDQQQRLETLWEREQQWRAFQQAWRAIADECDVQHLRHLLATYYDLPPSFHQRLTEDQVARLERVERALRLLDQLQASNDYMRLQRLYDPALLQEFNLVLDEAARHRIETLRRVNELLEARRTCDYRRMLLVACAIGQPEALNGHRLSLQLALRRFCEGIALEGVHASVERNDRGLFLIVHWRWPQDDLIEEVCIFWDERPLQLRPYASGELLLAGPRYRLIRRNTLPGANAAVSLPIRAAPPTLYIAVCAAVTDLPYSGRESENWYFGSYVQMMISPGGCAA